MKFDDVSYSEGVIDLLYDSNFLIPLLSKIYDASYCHMLITDVTKDSVVLTHCKDLAIDYLEDRTTTMLEDFDLDDMDDFTLDGLKEMWSIDLENVHLLPLDEFVEEFVEDEMDTDSFLTGFQSTICGYDFYDPIDFYDSTGHDFNDIYKIDNYILFIEE